MAICYTVHSIEPRVLASTDQCDAFHRLASLLEGYLICIDKSVQIKFGDRRWSWPRVSHRLYIRNQGTIYILRWLPALIFGYQSLIWHWRLLQELWKCCIQVRCYIEVEKVM